MVTHGKYQMDYSSKRHMIQHEELPGTEYRRGGVVRVCHAPSTRIYSSFSILYLLVNATYLLYTAYDMIHHTAVISQMVGLEKISPRGFRNCVGLRIYAVLLYIRNTS